MAVKIRLARHGSKGAPFYRIVVADSRSPRDGKFIDRIGTYNPRTQPSEIKVDEEKAREWLGKGAQPTEQVRKLLEISGVL
ncbi:MAG TPA: 30S ribosomal protein S16 [Rubrobacteraceae bacterium]|nr:30S ribosomal protein S16 [Rubrobacteraceae bacterium]